MDKKNIKDQDLDGLMNSLDSIVEKLSGDGVSLEDALTLYEEGVALVKECSSRLDAAERKINMLKISAQGEIEQTPFDLSTVE